MPEEPTGQRLPVQPDDELAHTILWLQEALNNLGANPRLTEDGKNGSRTMAAVSQFQRENGLPDTGLADAATIAAIERKSHAPTDGQGPGDLLAAIKQLIDRLQKGGGITPPASANDLTTILQQVTNVLQGLNIVPKSTAPAAPVQHPQQQAAQLQKIFDFITGFLNPAGQPQPLGQVNGALGQTIGNLLNGDKTAIGTIGAVVTALLPTCRPVAGSRTSSPNYPACRSRGIRRTCHAHLFGSRRLGRARQAGEMGAGHRAPSYEYKVANRPSPASGKGSPMPEGRNLIVRSDGTGNSAAKAFKTNVWRLYQALDLTDGASHEHVC